MNINISTSQLLVLYNLIYFLVVYQYFVQIELVLVSFLALPLTRLKRQTHPAATIAKLPSTDNSAFIPIVGPTQAFNSQPPFFANTESFQNTLDFPHARDAPIDYLVPPNPNSHISNLNFQDPAANLQNIDSFDATSPSSSASNNFASFPAFQNQFSQPNFQNQINHPQIPTTQSAQTSDQVQSISFQNPLAPSPTPSLIQNVAPPSLSNQQFLTNKISNPSKEPPLANQFPAIPPQVVNPNNFNRAEAQQSDRSNQGKHELGYDANEILAPPREESFGRNGEYDTINVPKFRRLNHVSGPPGPPLNPPGPPLGPPSNNQARQVPTNHFAAPNQFQTPSNQQFQPFNSFTPANQPTNDHLTPPNSPFSPASNQITSSQPFLKENTINSPNNIVWGSQKQQLNFAPTTNAPFLPTVPPTPQAQPNNLNFQNIPQFNQAQGPPQLQQFQQPPPNNQLYHLQNVNLNQNFALETPFTAQFDSFLPQGTVSDHTFPQHFRKRQVNSEEEEYEEQREEPESKYRHKAGPVYSFVKTDRDGHFKWSVRHPSRR